MDGNNKSGNLKNRTIEFAYSIIKFVEALPKNLVTEVASIATAKNNQH